MKALQKTSGGLVLYEREKGSGALRVLVAHPGGPFFRNKDDGWWSIPKGEPDPGEDLFLAALREFEEETGMVPQGPFLDLGWIRQNNGKKVFAWAFEGNWPENRLPVSNEITLEYPKGSGKEWTFPEIDRVAFLPIEEAKTKLRKSQAELLDRLVILLPSSDRARAAKD